MSNSLDIEAISRRHEELHFSEKALRQGREQSGEARWPFGDQIRLTLDDVKSLVARVEELEAALAKREPEADPLRAALIGILRADGYVIREPAWGDGSTVTGVPVIEFRNVEIHGDPKQALDYYTGMLAQTAHTASTFNPDAAASDMLGEDEPSLDHAIADDPVLSAPPQMCPNCEQPLPPDGKCRSTYVDCQKARVDPKEPLPQSDDELTSKPLENGQAVRLVGGLWDGRYAVALGTMSEHGNRPCVEVCARGVELANAAEASLVWVVNPTVDEPIAKTGPIDTMTAKPKRAPEPPKLVTEWAPDGRDFEGYAKDLGCDVARVQALVTSFKDWSSKSEPDQKQARWGGVFKAWAKLRLAQTTIPGA